ncbi:site-specific DNA-methyltransferase [Rhizorhabdus phycosphaerae]|uniref:site-specific DNA-methyltransferase n=1 Tax=Rhizorhabdus phycosphaerae TaxID=2711156 RepID=UPI0013E9E6FE|nr:site-specific DNA-methyltransferase [Rhizorhabdus phycosphaerae]
MPSLTWLTRDEDLKRAAAVPYRLLEADPAMSHGDQTAGNMLIQGDNLDALKALLPYYKGRVKCIYIDPPYNTRSDFDHYDDNLEHSQWLAMIYPRLELLHDLLAEEGSIWVSIDDNEGHYLKVVMDEIFGRQNFIIDIAWQKRDGPPNDRTIASIHEHILVWGKSRKQGDSRSRAEELFNLMPRSEKANSQYREYPDPDGIDPRGPFRKIDTTANGKGGRSVSSLIYPITNPFTKEEVYPREGTCWRHNREEMARLQADKRLFWGVKGDARTPMRKLFLSEAKSGMTTSSVWTELAFNQHASRQIELIFGYKASFETPKPEELLQRIIHVASNPGDLVLDSFLGSGTTAAVAHKMGRRWIGVEMGDHAVSHCAPRLVKVIDGEQGGISKSVEWQGGGGFAFYRLGEEVFDEEGRLRPGIKFAALAAHVWFSETGVPYHGAADSPYLGTHGARGFALLYNGILGDRSVTGGNVLTGALLASIRAMAGHDGPLTVYGEASRIGAVRLKAEGVTFKQTPYDVKAR